MWCFIHRIAIKRITFQFVAIVGAEGQAHDGSKEDELGPTDKMIKH